MKYFTINTPGASLLVNNFPESSNEKQKIKYIMRIGFISLALLLTSFQLLLALPVKSQKISSVKVRMELKNETLLSAFKKIEKQTSFRFVYRKGELKTLPSKNISSSIYTVEQVLKMLLEDTDLSFKQVDNNVLIQAIDTQTAGSVNLNESKESVADIVIRGQITDTQGETLPGVSIKLKGTAVGTTTDINGNYSINVPDKNSILVFTYVGFVTREIAVSDDVTINVKLEAANTALNEVVVTALGIKRAAKSLTYSAQVIDGSGLNEAKETNVINSLQGKVSGVVISKSATGPGGSSRVILRGNRSITGGNEPLYVIDGVPMNSGKRASGGGSFGGRDGGGGISMINPDNIESMTILKGASAAALYGSAGQNGAIVITTKSGKKGDISVNYNGGFTVDKAIALPELQYEYGQGDAGVYSPSSEHSYGPKADGRSVTLWNGSTVPYVGQPDNLNNFFREAKTINNSISASGGNDKMRTFFSYGNTTAEGILRNNDMTRHNVDLKLDNNISKKLSFSTKISYIYQEVNNMPATGEAGYALSSMYRAPTSIPLSEMKKYNYTDVNGIEMQSYWKPGSSILSNPYWDMERDLFFEKKDRVLGLFSAKYEFNDWIDFQVRGSIDKTLEKTDRQIYNDTYTTYGIGSTYVVEDFMRQSTNLDALVSFRRDLTKTINLTGNLGGSLQQGSATSASVDARGLSKQNYFFMVNAKNPLALNGYSQSPQVQSLYGTATVSYKDYLFLDATARNDWSSALPKGNQSYFYPSVGVTGIVSEMLSLPSWVLYGKVRTSLAYSGSGGSAYRDRNYYSVANGGFIGTPATRSLPTYKPELTSAFEVGTEWRLFDGRVGIDFTYYNTDTKNQLITISTPAASLFSSQYINAGLINNKGIEGTLNLTPVRSSSFKWDASFNYGKNVNKIVRLTNEVTRAVMSDDRQVLVDASVGGSYGDMYVIGWQKDAQGRPLVTSAGSPMLTKKNVYAGNFNPRYNLGFNNTFTFKDVSFGFLLDYRNGGTVIAGTQALLDADGHSKASLRGREGGIVLDAYTVDGQKNTKSISSQSYFGTIGERYPAGEFYAYSGTNLRLREAVLGYNLKNLITENKFIRGARISLVGRNLFFLQKDAPFDPEVLLGTGNVAGSEYNSLPSTRNVGLNLMLSF